MTAKIIGLEARRFARGLEPSKGSSGPKLPRETWVVPPDAKLDAGALLCPRCGYENLHHEDLRIFRRSEDADGDVVRLSARCSHNEPARTPLAEASFPNTTRRHSIELTFSCENCGDDAPQLVLSIAQYKGATVLRWKEQSSTRRAGA